MTVTSDEVVPSEQVVDEWIRRISGEQICQRVQLLWSAIQRQTDGEANGAMDERAAGRPCCTQARQTKTSYLDVLLYSARAIQVMIDENAAVAMPNAHGPRGAPARTAVWCSYLKWFTRMLFTKPQTEAEAQYVMQKAHAMLCAVMAFPRTAVNLRENYLECVGQRCDAEQPPHPAPPPAESARRGEHGGQHTISDDTTKTVGIATSTLTSSTSLANTAHLIRDVKPPCVFDLTTKDGLNHVLTALPPHMTLAHRNGTIHLQLFNPLPIPPIHFVRSGYRCDGCNVCNMHVGYQAVPYNENTETAREQRNDAHFVGATRFGYDLCIACAVQLFCEQHARLKSCLSAPFYTHFSTSPECAVSVIAVVSRRTMREGIVYGNHFAPHGKAEQDGERVGEAEPRWPPLSTLSCSNSFSIAGYATAPVFSAAPVVSETELRRCLTTVPPPPRRRPSRRHLDASREPGCVADVYSPSSRCRVRPTTQVMLRVAVAPRAARAMAWVVTETERASDDAEEGKNKLHVEMERDEIEGTRSITVARAPYEPPVNWQTFTRVRRVTTSGEVNGNDPSTLPASSACVSAEEEDGTQATLSTQEPSRSEGDGGGGVECCAVCLSPLFNGMPVLTTRCGHTFHVECIQELARASHDVCPLCRKANVLPDMGVSSALRENVYEVEVTLTEQQARVPCLRICVASLLPSNGQYYNVTNLVAARCIAVEPAK